jgi:hypothetical protein
MNRRTRCVVTAAGLAALATAVAGCGTAGPARPLAAAVTVPAVPLNTSVTTAAGSWATVVMGGSAAQHNNFWQLFIRPAGSTRWTLVTPPGTADNGGLVLAAGAGQALVTAFRPSQDLTFTPLTRTSDLGHAWSALSPLDAALAATPDSLAVQPGTGRLLALLGTGTAEQGNPTGTGWTTLVTARALSATRAGKSCGLRALTAAAYTPAGTPLLAGTCTRLGAVGIFAGSAHAWRAAGPALPAAFAHQTITVLRLATVGNQTTALLAASTGPHTTLLGASSTDAGSTWAMTPPLAAGHDPIASASFGPGQTAAVITAGGQGDLLAAGQWERLPALPNGTAALVPGADGTTDALAVHGATLTIWQLADSTASWAREQTIEVPIQYGSSS